MLYQGKKRTGRVTLTSWKAKSAFLVEGNLLKAREVGKAREMTSKGIDKESEMFCISPKHQMLSDSSSAHLLNTSW